MNKINKKRLSTNEENSLKSGLIIDNSIKVSYNKDSNILTNIILLLIAFIGLFGTVFSFITMFNIDVNTHSLVIYLVAFFILFSIISLLPDKFLLTIFPILLIFLYIFKDYIQEVTLGFKIVSNHIADVVSSAGIWTKYNSIPNDIVSYEYTTIFLKFCVFLLSGLICLFTIKVQSCVMGFILTFPFLECGIYFGAIPKYTYCFMVISYWIALLSMTFSGCRKTTKNKQAGFVRIGNSFFAKSDCNFKISEKVGICTIIMCLICAILSSSIVSISNYQRSDNINSIRNDVKDTIENFSFDDASYYISRLGNMFTSNSNGNFNGTLGQKDTITHKGEEKLLLYTTEIPSNDIYLKSYVGSIYTSRSWDILQNSEYKTSIFDTFKDAQIYPQTLANSLLQDMYSSYKVTILPTNKKTKTTLLPYFSKLDGSFSYVNDTTIKANDNSKYSFDILKISSEDIILSLNGIPTPNNFNNDEYRKFVNQHYLTIDDNSNMKEVKEIFQQYLGTYNLDFDTFNATADIYTKIDYIKLFLCSNYDYTLSPGKTPLDKDYVLYFLKECQKGYCSHFASSGVILCRMLDIPARYVEGYYISQSNFSSNAEVITEDSNSNYKLSVKDDIAHAWTEIYIDNIGWINVDFTPGFNGNPTYESFHQTSETSISENLPNIENVSQEEQTQIAPVTEVTTEVTSFNDAYTVTEQSLLNTREEPTNNKFDLRLLKHILTVIIIIALIITFIILRRKYIIKKRNEKISSNNIKTSILESYKYSLLILKYLKFPHEDTTPYLKFAKEVSKNIDYAKDFSKIVDIVLKSNMSTLPISIEEKSIVEDFANNMAITTFERLSKVHKIWFKYILCLI